MVINVEPNKTNIGVTFSAVGLTDEKIYTKTPIVDKAKSIITKEINIIFIILLFILSSFKINFR